MSFGFSIGDFLAVSGLVSKVVGALRGTRAEYQELIRMLESLERALHQVDKFKCREDQAIAIQQIKSSALSCRLPLEQFLAKVEGYKKSLGPEKSAVRLKDAGRVLKDGGRKVQYAFSMKDEVAALQKNLTMHIEVINMRMVLLGLDMFVVASEQNGKTQEKLMTGFDGFARELTLVKTNVGSQTLAFKENASELKKLLWVIYGEIMTPLKSLSQTVTKVCASMDQIYTIMLELRDNVLGIDTRFTYFQAPVRVEDALGRVFPFPSECSVQALVSEIEFKFQEGPGKKEVMAGDFEIFNAKDTNQLFNISGHNIFVPGMSINMAIIFEKDLFGNVDKCPMPHCASRIFMEAIGGGKTCSECKVWFNQASKGRWKPLRRSTQFEAPRANEFEHKSFFRSIIPEASDFSGEETIIKTEQTDSDETSISDFKRIRYDPSLQALVRCKRIPRVIDPLQALYLWNKICQGEVADSRQLIQREHEARGSKTRLQRMISHLYKADVAPSYLEVLALTEISMCSEVYVNQSTSKLLLTPPWPLSGPVADGTSCVLFELHDYVHLKRMITSLCKDPERASLDAVYMNTVSVVMDEGQRVRRRLVSILESIRRARSRSSMHIVSTENEIGNGSGEVSAPSQAHSQA